MTTYLKIAHVDLSLFEIVDENIDYYTIFFFILFKSLAPGRFELNVK